eukprot:GHUV01019737.1.p1 GENE.GHUV01019737.1~~GHUV01019737.1.p1  ORF type:complete len:154 (+),score=35.92 GHUV01019737.1:790-1251(+)
MQALVPCAATAASLHHLAAAAVWFQQSAKAHWLVSTQLLSTPASLDLSSAPARSSWLRHGTRSISSSSSDAGSTAQIDTATQGSGGSASSSKPITTAEIKQLRAEIFEQHIGDGRRSGRKAILKPLRGRIIADWYFTLTGPKMHMFDDPHEEE